MTEDEAKISMQPINWENHWPLSTQINDLGMSQRTVTCMRNFAGCKTVGDVVALSEAQLVGIPNIGRKSINEIKETLMRGPPEQPVNKDELIRDLRCQVSYWKGRYEGIMAGIEWFRKP